MQAELHTLSSLLTGVLAKSKTWLRTSGTRTVLLLVLSVVLLRLVRVLTQKLSQTVEGFTLSAERQKRAHTLSHIVRAAATAVLCTVTALLLLAEAGVNLAPLLAAAGMGGLAIGFGAQSQVRMVTNTTARPGRIYEGCHERPRRT